MWSAPKARTVSVLRGLAVAMTMAPASFASWTVKPPTPPPAPLTSSHAGGIDAAAARRGRNESHTALAVPFNRSRREATPQTVTGTLFLRAALAAVAPTQKHYGEHLPVSRRVARINGSVAAPTDGAGLGGARGPPFHRGPSPRRVWA